MKRGALGREMTTTAVKKSGGRRIRPDEMMSDAFVIITDNLSGS